MRFGVRVAGLSTFLLVFGDNGCTAWMKEYRSYLTRLNGCCLYKVTMGLVITISTQNSDAKRRGTVSVCTVKMSLLCGVGVRYTGVLTAMFSFRPIQAPYIDAQSAWASRALGACRQLCSL